MPLVQSSSKAAFSKNVVSEMHTGKSQAQSVAIAYSVKRKSRSYSDDVIKKARKK